MRREPAFAFAALLCVGFAAGQQAAPPTPPPAAGSQSGAMTVYYAGPGVTAPSLLPITFTDVVASGKCQKLDGTAELSAFVDAQGIPRYVFLLQPIGNNLDKVAIYIADADRFNPGTRNGQPAAVAATIKASIQSCIEEKNDEHGQKIPLPPASFYASAAGRSPAIYIEAHPSFWTVPLPPKQITPLSFHTRLADASALQSY